MPIRKYKSGHELRIVVAGKRVEIYLPGTSRTKAEEIERHVKGILACTQAGLPIESIDARWMASIDEKLAGKLSRRGIIPERAAAEAVPSFREAADCYLGSHSVKESTKQQLRIAFNEFSEWLTAKRKHSLTIDKITNGDASKFMSWCRSKNAEATARKKCSRVKQVFTQAVRDQVIVRNPFDGVATSAIAQKESDLVEVTEETIREIIRKTEDPDARMVLALCRFGGFRFHETAVTKWSDVDLEEGMIRVRSNKTPPVRNCPVFASLRPYLEEVPESRRKGPLQKRWPEDSNSRTQLVKIIEKAGYECWPKPTHMLRKNRATDLLEKFPPKEVAAWLGHDVQVLLKHYAILKSANVDRAKLDA